MYNLQNYNIWASSFLATEDQKTSNQIVGYKTSSYGIVFGIDRYLNDRIRAGIAVSHTRFNVEHKSYNIKEIITSSYLLSLYGKHYFNNKLFIQGTATIGYYMTKSKESIFLDTPKSRSYSGNILVSHNNHLYKKTTIAPSLGINYIYLKTADYQSTKSTNIYSILNKKQSITTGVIGATIKHLNAENKIIPEIHGFVHHTLQNKKSSMQAQANKVLQDINIIKPQEFPKTSYQLGTKLTIIAVNKNIMEFSISCDSYLAKKYTSYTGSINIKAKL